MGKNTFHNFYPVQWLGVAAEQVKISQSEWEGVARDSDRRIKGEAAGSHHTPTRGSSSVKLVASIQTKYT